MNLTLLPSHWCEGGALPSLHSPSMRGKNFGDHQRDKRLVNSLLRLSQSGLDANMDGI
jgi:hypothetical protein